MNDKGGTPEDSNSDRESVVTSYEKIEGVTRSMAESLFDSGFVNMEELGEALPEELAMLDGIGMITANKIMEHLGEKGGTTIGDEKKEEKKEEKGDKKEEPGADEISHKEPEVKVEAEDPDKKIIKDDAKKEPKPEQEKKDAPKEGPKGGKTSNELEGWLSGDSGGKDALEDWLRGGADDSGTKPKKDSGKKEEIPEPKGDAPSSAPGTPDEGSEDSLKKWLSGEEDTALEEWLTAEPEPEEEATEISFSAEGVAEMKGYVESLVKDISSGKSKVADVVSENAALKQSLAEEMKQREEIERELDNVKKSSVAVVKYIKAQQAKLKGKDTAKLQEMLDKQAMVKEKLEIKLQETESEVRALKEQMEKKMEEMAPDQKEAQEKEIQLIEMQKDLAIKEKSLLQKEEALASGEGILLREINGDSEGGTGALSPEQIEAWDQEKQTLLDEKAEAEKQLEEALLEKKHLEEQLKHSGMDDTEVNRDLVIKEKELANREKEFMLKTEQFKDVNRTVALKDEEIKKLRETVAFKEEELLRREEDLMHREKILDLERRKVAEAKKGVGSMEQQEAQKRLEDLKAQVAEKEREIRTKEKYMSAKEEELKVREKGLIEEEIDAREEDRKLEWTIEKTKTGVTRLDDLLMGGAPFGSNIAIYGPPFVGKETVMNIFVAEGLKKGIPAIWVITDKSPAEVRDEMGFVVSGYEEYEKMGLIRYIDTYSASMGEEGDDPYTTYISDISETKEILKAVDVVTKELKAEHKYYRLVFRSVSTLVAYLGATEAFKFLQPFTGRRKRDKAVSMYAIEKGMHKDEEIQSISHTMDGNIDFKTEQLKTYLAVLGICDVQSRSYVEYSHSKQSINIGSFSLDHIR